MIYSWKFKQCDHFQLWKWYRAMCIFTCTTMIYENIWSDDFLNDNLSSKCSMIVEFIDQNSKMIPLHDHTFPVKLDLMWTYLCHFLASSWQVHSKDDQHPCDDIVSVFLSVLHSDHDAQVWSMFHYDHNGCVGDLLHWCDYFYVENLQACWKDLVVQVDAFAPEKKEGSGMG